MKVVKLIHGVLFVFGSFIAAGQLTFSCGTDINSDNISDLRLQNQQWIESDGFSQHRNYTGTTYFVPVQIHIIRQNNGTGGINATDALAAFNRMNAHYIEASIHFYQCSAINYIDDDTYYNYDKSQKNDLDNDYGVSNVANIYVANTTTSGSSNICGHAAFPGGIDLIIQSKSCMKNGSTLIHEMGHYLGLYHTHETSFGDESVNGSDCLVDGDLICDTPADPRLNTSNNLNQSGCTYYGSDLDEDGILYQPMTENFMSYSGKGCRIAFTDGQRAKIHNTLLTSRNYLNCNNNQALASFFYVRANDDCTTGKQFDFYNAALGNPAVHMWDFGDGTLGSFAESPTHSYANPGIYTVRHTVLSITGSDFYEQKVLVGAVAPPYFNDFESSDALDDFEIKMQMKNTLSRSTLLSSGGTAALLLEGTEGSALGSPFFKTPTVANVFDFLFNPYFKSAVYLCVDATNQSNLQLSFDKRQFRYGNDNYTNVRITVNGQAVHPVLQVSTANIDDNVFSTVTIDLSAYDGQVFTLGIEGSHRYKVDRTTSLSGSGTFIDNLDISSSTVISPLESIEDHELSAYPNPTSNWVYISGLEARGAASIMVLNQLGQSVRSNVMVEDKGFGEWRLSVEHLNPGVYFIHAENTVIKVQKL